MPKVPGEPLTKVTLNLFSADLESLTRYPGWSTWIREVVHEAVEDKDVRCPGCGHEFNKDWENG